MDTRGKRSSSVRKKALDIYQYKCANCGTSSNVELHHIVPLAFGGNDIISNMIPLCHACHNATHHAKSISKYTRKASNAGRPPKCDDEAAFSAMDMWANGDIGERRCQELMRLSGKTKVKQTSQYIKWKRSRGIENVKNYFDVTATLSPRKLVKEKAVVGYIQYLDGRTEAIYYHDGYENDKIKYLYFFSETDKQELTWEQIKLIVLLASQTPQVMKQKKIASDEFGEMSKSLFMLPMDNFGRIIQDIPEIEILDKANEDSAPLPIKRALEKFNAELYMIA